MFSKATFNFLDELAANNNRKWFEANKQRYESLVREPALEFIAAMGSVLEQIHNQGFDVQVFCGGVDSPTMRRSSRRWTWRKSFRPAPSPAK